jgi:hypothetical protein
MELVVFVAAIYLIPALIASLRGHKSKWAIIALNVLLGWSLIGWVVAFIWSLTSAKEKRPVVYMMTTAVDGTTKAISAVIADAPKSRLEDYARQIPWWARITVLIGLIALIGAMASSH